MVQWRRYSELVLQLGTPSSFSSFKATSNARNDQMFKEATEFALSIKILDKDMKTLLKTIMAHFKNLRCILVSPLPRGYSWDAEGNGGILPIESQPQLLGANMEVEAIPQAAELARERIQLEVLEPLGEWMKVYRQIADRMKDLEVLRLELDSRRRTVENLQGKLTRQQSVQYSNNNRQKGHIDIKVTEDVIAHKGDKLNKTHNEFMEMEDRVYNSLYTLVRDTAVLRDYTHCCLMIMQSAFESAAKAYETQPATQLSTTNGVGAAGGFVPPPESKYEAQLAGGDRPAQATPKSALGGFFSRLYSGKSGKVPASPRQDANDRLDQAPPYVYNASARHLGAYPPSQRQTEDSEGMQQQGMPPAAGTYIQTGYQPSEMRQTSQYTQQAHTGYAAPPYQAQGAGGQQYAPQATGGSQHYMQGGQQYAPQPTGGSQYMAQQYAPAPPQQQQQSPLRYQPQGYQAQHAYQQQASPLPQMQTMTAGGDWNANGV